jgi:hypothetical protein
MTELREQALESTEFGEFEMAAATREHEFLAVRALFLRFLEAGGDARGARRRAVEACPGGLQPVRPVP